MRNKILLLLGFILFTIQISQAQNIESIQFTLDSTYSKSPFYGNILITKNNKVLLERSYGYADALDKKPLTKQNSFQSYLYQLMQARESMEFLYLEATKLGED